MGNIFSSEEKLLRHQREELVGGRNSRKISRIYEQYGYRHPSDPFERPYEHRYKKRRNVSFHGKYGRHDHFRGKSHSLNAILEELYSLGPDDTLEEGGRKINYETGGSLIPRIKLKRSTSSLHEERSYKTLCKMSSESDIYIKGNSSPDLIMNDEDNDVNTKLPGNSISILLNDHSYGEIRKSDESYFAKNFDDCMKRLQLIEKEHELIEREDDDIQFFMPHKDKENRQEKNNSTTETIYDYECALNNVENGLEKVEHEVKNSEKPESCLKLYSTPVEEVKPNDKDSTYNQESKEPTTVNWYSNLKQQFEKGEQENQEHKTKEMSCRITGATLKNQNEKPKSDEEKEKDTRHYFSRLVKTNKSLLDEELPDPDKVKHIRAMFHENLNSTLKRKLDKKLGGSLQNISIRSSEQQMSRPLSAQCYRNDLYGEAGGSQKSDEEKEQKVSEKETSRPSKDGTGEFSIENTKKKLFEKSEKDLKQAREQRNRRVLQPKWTDTGSISSGIGSDLSSYDTDLECYSREGTEQDEMAVSDDDLLEEVKDKHYVQNEVLEKIRSYGTSVTYYGGEMITCSVGPLLSPTTQAIMEEIEEKYGHETSPSRSFDEFYRKYVETNEHARKKKLGRTRSFGQSDVFQKPKVLNNTEIDMYKNDLEIEIGIKKPVGIPQNTLKKKVTKSTSLGSNMEEKATEKYSEPSILTSTEARDPENPTKQVSDAGYDPVVENGAINKTGAETATNIDEIRNTTTNPQPLEKIENRIESPEEKQIEPTAPREDEPEKPKHQKEPPLYSRSQSTPGSFLANGQTNKCETTLNQHPAKEIYFSYEKSIFDGKRKPDMEFEEFEVCESLSEKLEKLEKTNSHEKSTEQQYDTSPLSDIDAKFQNPIEKQLGFVTSPTEHPEDEDDNDDKTKTQTDRTTDWETPIAGETKTTKTERRISKSNHSRWPIETTVVVDIQKTTEQTPKIITSGKTVAKTKIRLF